MDAGAELMLYGPANTTQSLTTGENRGFYHASKILAFRPGPWLLVAHGGRDTGPFFMRFALPPQPPWVHRPNLSIVDKARDVDLSWDGSLYASTDIATLSLYRYVFDRGSVLTTLIAGVQCHVPAQTGRAVIPREWLRDFPPTLRNEGAYSLALEIRPGRDATFAIPLPSGGGAGGILRTSRRVVLRVEVR